MVLQGLPGSLSVRYLHTAGVPAWSYRSAELVDYGSAASGTDS